jgi:hypothetical protein
MWAGEVCCLGICHLSHHHSIGIISKWALSQDYLSVCWPYTICIVLLYTMRLTRRVGCGTTLSDSLESNEMEKLVGRQHVFKFPDILLWVD